MRVPDQRPAAKTLRLKTDRTAAKLADARKPQSNAVLSPSASRLATVKIATPTGTSSDTSTPRSTPARKPLGNLTITPNKIETLRFQDSCTIRAEVSPLKSQVRHRRAGVDTITSPVPKIAVEAVSYGKAELWTPKNRATGTETPCSGEYLWKNEFRKNQHPDIKDAPVHTPSLVTKTSGDIDQASRKPTNFRSFGLDAQSTVSTLSKNRLTRLEREQWLAKLDEPWDGDTELTHDRKKPKFKLQRTRREICNSDPIPQTTPPHIESLRVRARQFVEETLRKDDSSPQRDVPAKATVIWRNDQPRQLVKNENLEGVIETPKVIASHSSLPVKPAIKYCRHRFLAGQAVYDPFDEHFIMESAYLKALEKLSKRKIWDHNSSILSSVPNDAELRLLFIIAHDEIQEQTTSTKNVAPEVVKIVQQVEREQVFLRKCYERAGLQIAAQLNVTAKTPMRCPPGFASQLEEIDSVLTTTTCPSNFQVPKKRKSVKSVRWDPAIIEAGPIVERHQARDEVKGLTKRAPVRKTCPTAHEDENIDEMIRDWKDLDGKSVAKLLKALRELKTDDDEGMTETGKSVATNLNPYAAEFKPSCRQTERQGDQTSAHSGMRQGIEPIWVRTVRVSTDPQPAPASRQPVAPKKVVIDDPKSHGREVDTFEGWYGELQMAEFVKRYPMTGTRIQDGQSPKLPRKRRPRRVLQDPAVTGRAAVVQRELEILLYESKERKALEPIWE